MKSAIALISVGFLILILSLGSWGLTRPSAEAGNAASFEQAVSQAAAGRTGPAPEAVVPAAPASEMDSEPVPQMVHFTVSQASNAADRVPVALRIPALDQEAEIIPVGVEDNGDMEVPDNVRQVAWYRYGAAPGEPGSAVLAAHVDLRGQGPGVFFELRTLDPGNLVYVEFDDGTSETYLTRARAVYEKAELPTDAIFRRVGPPVLTLITCGGDFNRSQRAYDSNVVVYAVPLDTVPLPAS